MPGNGRGVWRWSRWKDGGRGPWRVGDDLLGPVEIILVGVVVDGLPADPGPVRSDWRACGYQAECRRHRTDEVITQVRDASGKLWDVDKRFCRPYPSAELMAGCSISWEAKVDTGGMPYMVEYVGETGKAIHSEARPAEWVYHPVSRKRVDTAPLLPDRVLRLVEYRWR